jgi:hypothetical protein
MVGVDPERKTRRKVTWKERKKKRHRTYGIKRGKSRCGRTFTFLCGHHVFKRSGITHYDRKHSRRQQEEKNNRNEFLRKEPLLRFIILSVLISFSMCLLL